MSALGAASSAAMAPYRSVGTPPSTSGRQDLVFGGHDSVSNKRSANVTKDARAVHLDCSTDCLRIVGRRADQGEATQDLDYLRSVRTNRVLSWLGLTALSVGPYGTIGRALRHYRSAPCFASVGLYIAGKCRSPG